MSAEFFAPIVINRMDVLEVELAALSPIDGEFETQYQFTTTQPEITVVEEASRTRYLVTLGLEVSFSVKSDATERPENCGRVRAMGRFSGSLSDGADEERDASYRKYLEESGISLLYGHIRSVVTMLTSMSPVGPLPLAPIDATRLMDELRAGFQAGE